MILEKAKRKSPQQHGCIERGGGMLVKSDFLHQELVSSFTRVMIETLF
jgi:hypothetical protein